MATKTFRRDNDVDPNIHLPVMKINFFDRLSSAMIAGTLGLSFGVFAVWIWWMSVVPPYVQPLVPMEMVEISGGFEDGAPDETLKIESPEDPVENPSTEEVLDNVVVADVVENVVEMSEKATKQANQLMQQTSDATGTPGSADGTGRRPFGSGGGQGGIPNEQRWFIRYADQTSIEEYAKQLDFFGIELGALLPNGQLVIISGVSGTPKKEIKTSGKGETRLYMTWQGGNRKEADEKLFQKAGVNIQNAITMFHFYPKKTETLLLTQEFNYAKKKASEIRRTYFVVTKQGSGYTFVVTRQIYLR